MYTSILYYLCYTLATTQGMERKNTRSVYHFVMGDYEVPEQVEAGHPLVKNYFLQDNAGTAEGDMRGFILKGSIICSDANLQWQGTANRYENNEAYCIK